jgi:glycerol kinase
MTGGPDRLGGSLLVVDVGTSGVRAAVVRPDGAVEHARRQAVPPQTPAPGLVEVDARRVATAALELAGAVLEAGGPVAGVGIANQRATTVVWDRSTGEPVAPGIGWQDLRTVGTCLALQSEGLRLAPNMSATKLSSILDDVDPERSRAEALCFGTVDTWVAWTLSGGALHVTDATNAAVTGLVRTDAPEWDEAVLERLGVPPAMLPTIVDSSGAVGEARALPGAPPICGIAGDQQASLVGQGCVRPGMAKATFGTGGMLDLCTGSRRILADGDRTRSGAGTFPIVAWQRGSVPTWGVEAIMLSAGSCVEWLRDDLGVLESAAASASVAARCEATGDVWFVPALFGMGTPVWDFGARGTVLGLTRGSGRAELVRAVLEGVAHRGADLLEAAEAASGASVASLRVDGGMAENDVFVTALAEAVGRPVETSTEVEATTLGAGYLAGMATGTWRDEDDVAAAYRPRRTVEPTGSDADRAAVRRRWLAARERATGTIPELSGIAF